MRHTLLVGSRPVVELAREIEDRRRLVTERAIAVVHAGRHEQGEPPAILRVTLGIPPVTIVSIGTFLPSSSNSVSNCNTACFVGEKLPLR